MSVRTRAKRRRRESPAHRRTPLLRQNTSTIGAMRIHEVALELLISDSMVRKVIDSGDLHAGCIGKRKIVFREDLEAFKAKLRGVDQGAVT